MKWNLLEEEVLSRQLILNFFTHSFERVEGTFKISLELVASGENNIHYLQSMHL